jgi:hypothetical protein
MELTGKNELLSYFNINDVRYQRFEDNYTIRKLNSGCLTTGNKLFKPIIHTFHLYDTTFRNTIDDDFEKLTHYYLKGYFYDTADFGITYTTNTNKQSIKFRVALSNSNVGGSLNYIDLGIYMDEYVDAFSHMFNGLSTITAFNDAVMFIAQRIVTNCMLELVNAMAREIQEETTPNGIVAKSIQYIAQTLLFNSIRIERRNKWQVVVNFEFNATEAYNKVREMDEFCCLMNEVSTKIYYIYDDVHKKYTVKCPYIVAPSMQPLTFTPMHMINYLPITRKSKNMAPQPIENYSDLYNAESNDSYKVASWKAMKPSARKSVNRSDNNSYKVASWKAMEPYSNVIQNNAQSTVNNSYKVASWKAIEPQSAVMQDSYKPNSFKPIAFKPSYMMNNAQSTVNNSYKVASWKAVIQDSYKPNSFKPIAFKPSYMMNNAQSTVNNSYKVASWKALMQGSYKPNSFKPIAFKPSYMMNNVPSKKGSPIFKQPIENNSYNNSYNNSVKRHTISKKVSRMPIKTGPTRKRKRSSK